MTRYCEKLAVCGNETIHLLEHSGVGSGLLSRNRARGEHCSLASELKSVFELGFRVRPRIRLRSGIAGRSRSGFGEGSGSIGCTQSEVRIGVWMKFRIRIRFQRRIWITMKAIAQVVVEKATI